MGGSISSENTRTNITISKELKAQLEELAKKDNRSFNNYVITVLKEHVDNLRNSYIPYFNTVGSTVIGGIEITGQNMFDYGQRSKISGESYIEKFYFNPSATWHGGDYHGGYGVMASFSAYSEMVNFYKDTVKDFRKRYGI